MNSAIRLLSLVALLCIVVVTATIPGPPNERFVLETEIATNENMVNISQGAIEGAVYTTARAFYSIPFAAPPVGDLRWKAPQPPLSWTGVRKAKMLGPGCPQVCDLPPFTCPLFGYSEDCLRLDVYTPRLTTIQSEGPRPVMVFFYGGNFKQGGSATPLYNGDYLANNTKVITVVVNYRLGALGFFSNDVAKGNNAIRDQTAALQWVKQNIGAFGGNPNKVTIFGQSAGGSSVACHLVSPQSRGLFNHAIMESNPITLYLLNKEKQDGLSGRFAKEIGCARNDFSCLNSKNITEILQAQYSAVKFLPLSPLTIFMPWEPYVDKDVIEDQPMVAFTHGNYNHVPFMLGNVQDEGVIFIYSGFTTPVSPSLYRQILEIVFRGEANRVEAMYPIPSGSTDLRPVLSVMGTDFIWACPNRNISNAMWHHNSVYLYHFNHVMSFDPWGKNFQECKNYSCHGSELPFVFNSVNLSPYHFTPAEKMLSHSISTAWGNFATSGSPNSPYNGAPNWQNYNTFNDVDMQFEAPTSSAETAYRKKFCDFWDTVGYWRGNGVVPPKVAFYQAMQFARNLNNNNKN